MSRFFLLFLAVLGLPYSASAGDAALPAPAGLERLSLGEAEGLLLRENREIQAARRMVEGAGADAISAAARPNPTLSVNTASVRLDRNNGSGGPWDKQVDTTVRMEQLIERGGKREHRVAAADHAVRASRADLADTLRSQRLLLASAYYDLLLAQEKLDILKQTAQLYGKTLEAANLRLKVGDISPTDLARLQVEAYRAENDARQAQGELEKAQSGLSYLLGREREARRIRAADPWPDLPQPPPPQEFEEILAQRADVKAAQARIELADARRAQARALRTRDVSVGVQYEHYPPDNRNTVGLGVSIPLFLAYGYEGEIKRAEVDYADAQGALERVKAQALTEIDRARADLDAAAERLTRYREGVLEKAQKTAAAAELAYRHGAQGLMDLLDARRTLRAVQIEALAARSDYAKSLAAWRAALANE